MDTNYSMHTWWFNFAHLCMLMSRYMGTITGISDLDPVRWPNSHWRSVKVCLDHFFGLNSQFLVLV